MLEREAGMQVGDIVRKCVAFIGFRTPHGFQVEGTGFHFVTAVDETHWEQIVTARHVIDGFREDVPVCRLMNRHDKEPLIIETRKRDWVPHPDKTVDIAVLPTGNSYDLCQAYIREELDTAHVFDPEQSLTQAIIDRWDIGLGDDVFIAGAYTKRPGERRNLPIVRVGNIAAMAEEPIWPASPRKPAYLIEVRSLGGISGSPVFVNLAPMRRRPGGRIEPVDLSHPLFLLGIAIGVHDSHHPPDLAPQEDGAQSPVSDALFNTGITVALPVGLILEATQQSQIHDPRVQAAKMMKEQSGYRPTSAASAKPEPPTTEENPRHKEAFNSLVDAAAKKRPQGG